MIKFNGFKVLSKKEIIRFFIQLAVQNSFLRLIIIKKIIKTMYRNLVKVNAGEFPHQVQLDKIDMGSALFRSIHRNIKRKLFSKEWVKKFMDIHIDNMETRSETVKKARKRLGFDPPLFIVVSPEEKCNLNCPGCYAASNLKKSSHLDWDCLDQILTDKRELWGSYFTVISGGEPFLWKSKGKNILDMAQKHHQQFFLSYTNGTLIDKETSKRLKDLGNFTPAISVEGFEEETDKRRGKGTFKKILNAMENLRSDGVPFGVSITAMRHNWDLVSSEKFYDYWFSQHGATYGWIFQYMPIGRQGSIEMMITPQQRMEMFKRMWKMIRQKELFLADFWNSATATSGCIAAGRPGGYFYITWKGDVTPCVFMPYAATNIYDVYRNGGNLENVLNQKMFKKIRDWQANYGFSLYPDKKSTTPGNCAKNWLAPCFIRDHYDDFHRTAIECEVKPIDQEAQNALESKEFQQLMINYGKEFDLMSDPIWNDFYLKDKKKKMNQ